MAKESKKPTNNKDSSGLEEEKNYLNYFMLLLVFALGFAFYAFIDSFDNQQWESEGEEKIIYIKQPNLKVLCTGESKYLGYDPETNSVLSSCVFPELGIPNPTKADMLEDIPSVITEENTLNIKFSNCGLCPNACDKYSCTLAACCQVGE